MNRKSGLWLLCGAWLVASLVLSGCESTESPEDTITITPSSAELVGKNASVVLTASLASTNDSLVLPLNWRVSNAGLGGISGAKGVTAVYISNGNVGNNTITVDDQVGRSGVASITQVKPAPVSTNAP